MTTLIERGAIALFKQDQPDLIWESEHPLTKKTYCHRARTCLQAFRRPTKKMIRAASNSKTGALLGKAFWLAMIDAELDEKEPTDA